jgi:predicted nucleic acid-binding Zn ribbon protein
MVATRRAFVILFSLILILDLFLWIVALASGYNISKELTTIFWMTALRLITLIVLANRFLRMK